MPKSLQDMQRKIFSEWLLNSKDYEIAAGYNIEMYTNLADYPKGNPEDLVIFLIRKFLTSARTYAKYPK